MPTSPFVQAVDGKYTCPREGCSKSCNAPNSLRKHCRRRHQMNFTTHRAKEISIEEKRDRHRLYCAVYRRKKQAAKERVTSRFDYFTAEDADEHGAFGRVYPLVEYRPSMIEGAGNGLFACEDLMPDDIVTWCAGKVTETEPDDPSYAIKLDVGFFDCIRVPTIGKGMASFVNRENRSKAKFRKNCHIIFCRGKKHSLYLEITKPVKAGKELYTTYSHGYRIQKNK